ncbi:hypothetical protein CDV36_003551 [Fusarium kuroshium]|uniref:Xylanolytic transcriptional activator regulatory domain-containing protein n=1 Tax=Fusarium kuroshium TaxID=2010991 RepID=A0A3M2SGW0_9HYPO|nr:hypothetical protein CDV36_003551 [Fusarium kuroshium]
MGDACKFFASRAKVYLDLELQTPTIATLQALVILCEHEAAQGRDSQGWIYSGIATRILSDLGLQFHGTSPDETESCGADVADVKARVFWSVVHLDTLLYHEIRILLHRPLIGSSSPATNLQSLSPRSGNAAESSHDICTNSASEIIRLMGQFRDRFGLCHLSAYCVHILMTAGILLAYNTSLKTQTSEFRTKSASLTLASIRMMTELTPTFPSAHRALEVLTSLRREWQNCN